MTAQIGDIQLFPAGAAPSGWLPCDGRTLHVSQYNSLFVVLGNKHGGDGIIDFGLPDKTADAPSGQLYYIACDGPVPVATALGEQDVFEPSGDSPTPPLVRTG